jgi:hypothetical protein
MITALCASLSLVISTIVVGYANLISHDGPYFSPVFVAFFAFVLPVTVVVVFFQVGMLLWEIRAGHRSKRTYLLLGVLCGILSGWLLFTLFQSSESGFLQLLLFVTFAMFQSVLSLSSQYFANTRGWI